MMIFHSPPTSPFPPIHKKKNDFQRQQQQQRQVDNECMTE